MATITAIELQKRRPDRVNIDLDGVFAFSLSAILATGLKVGQHLDPQQVAALQTRDTDESAYQHALRFLGIRDRSEAELRNYLRRRKLADDVLERTLARLREHQHADDARFAEAWVENRSTFRPRGRRALTWELRQKGVSAEVVDTALADLDEISLAYQAGIKKARQLSAAPWQDFRLRVSAYLARRGFEASIVTTTVSRLWTEMHAGQPSLNEEDIP